jgi:hypothetical protein
MGNPSPEDQWLQNPVFGIPQKLFSTAGGGDGFSVSLTFPVETPEVSAWNGKIKVKYKGKFTFDATVGGPKGAAVTTLDAAKGIGAKASKTWWQGSGSVTLRGIDILKNPKVTSEGSINKEGVTVKTADSVDTPLGTVTFTAILVEYKPPKPPVYGSLAGSLKGTKKFDDMTVDGISVHDISVSTEFGFEVAPQYVKVIADAILDGLKKSGQNVVETVATDAALGFAIDASLVVAAIGTMAGVFNELAKAVDQKQLREQVGLARNLYTTGLGKALRGEPKSGSGWELAGWVAGDKLFQKAMAKGRSSHPDWDDDQLRDKVAVAAGRVETSADVQTAIKRYTGTGFWARWVEANHGVGTFLGDAKEACTACFGRPVLNSNDPDLELWKKASVLPDLLK